MAGVHHRMPLILQRKDIEKWLFSQGEAIRLLNSHFEDLEKKAINENQEKYQQMSLF